MSHQPERKEKNCLNCGTTVAGRYCQTCGQENSNPKQSAWGLITHFVFDVLHFDGKFFHTVSGLFRKPGFVPKQYTAGKRAAYLDPIRMYLFMSAVFFLIFYSITDVRSSVGSATDDWELKGKERWEHTGQVYARLQRDSANPALREELRLLSDTAYNIRLLDPSRSDIDSGLRTRFRNKDFLLVANRRRPDTASAEQASQNWLERRLETQMEKAQEKYGGSINATIIGLFDGFLHKFPYLLFLSLPFFALILKLVYLRRKSLYYSDHAVFTLYHYIVSFILMLLFFFFKWLRSTTDLRFFNVFSILAFLGGGIYLLISMKRFYGQGWGKTILKFLLVNLLASVVLLLLTFLFILFSIINL